MTVKPIAYSYWRSIKRGARLFLDVPAGVQEDVRTAARQDVAKGGCTVEQYERLIGERYGEAEQ